VQVLPAEQVFYYHTDPAGTPLAMTDSSGNVVWRADYKPFGEEQSVISSVPNDKRFIGKEKDEETGFSYFGARYENAKIGRFIAPDPERVVDPKTSKTNEDMLLNPQRLNTYAYALNNPYRLVDPDGKATYQINRKLGGNEARSTWNPISHTFIAVTNANGDVIHTYSWSGSFFEARWVPENQKGDMDAATEAIKSGKAFMISDGFLDPYIDKAYQELYKSGSETYNPIFNNCKHHSRDLVERALELAGGSSEKEPAKASGPGLMVRIPTKPVMSQ